MTKLDTTRRARRFAPRSMTRGLAFAALLLAGGAAPKPAFAVDAPSAQDMIYIENNDTRTGQNAIYAYRRAATGAMSALPGSPYLMGGAGFANTRDTDQNVVVNPDQTLLFAVNSGSNTIAVMRINLDGSLTAVPGSPFASGGILPVSVGYANNRLWVVNQGDATFNSPPNYTGFAVGDDGSLTPIPGATRSLGYNSQPTQALTTTQGPLLFGADFGSAQLQAFQISAVGALQPSPNSPLSTFNPLGLTTHPTQPILYVGFPFQAQLGVFTFSDSGALTRITTATNSGAAICWLSATRDGKNLYSTNTGDDSVSWYDLTNPLAPRERQHLAVNGGGGPFQLSVNPTDSYVYVLNQRFGSNLSDNALHVFRIAPNGSLTETHSVVLPVGAYALPQGVAVIQPPVSVSGQITLEGTALAAVAGQTLTFQFRPTDNSAGFTRQATLDANGAFTLTHLPPLRYTVRVKGAKWLAQTTTIDATQGDVSTLAAALPGGDANGDNSVDANDFGVFVSAYNSLANVPGSGYNAAADFNNDGSVDATDFGILVGNYNTIGAN